jgi:hypothetical protein
MSTYLTLEPGRIEFHDSSSNHWTRNEQGVLDEVRRPD